MNVSLVFFFIQLPPFPPVQKCEKYKAAAGFENENQLPISNQSVDMVFAMIYFTFLTQHYIVLNHTTFFFTSFKDFEVFVVL